MNFHIDDNILANLKTQAETDDENVTDGCDVASETFMEVLEGFVESGTDDGNTAYTAVGDDPLDGGRESTHSRFEFPWHCEERDFLQAYTHDVGMEPNDVLFDVNSSTNTRTDIKIKGCEGIIWSKIPLSPAIVDDLPGFLPTGKGPARSVSNPLEAWSLLMDTPMLNQIVKGTNEVIKATRQKEPHKRRLIDLTELKALLGLYYLCGVLRNSYYSGPLEELWTLELGNSIFRATMTYQRFEYLSECLCYSDKEAETPSPLDEVAGMWEKLIINCRSYYAPSDLCMIDEHILDLDVEASYDSFDHILQNQTKSKGVRFITMCDPKTLYICNALVVTHSQPIDQEVYQLVSDIKGTRRCLCLTERFSSMDLLQKLKQCQLQVVGALVQTAEDIPSELCNGCHVPQVWHTANECTLIATPTKFLLTNGLSARVNAFNLYKTIKNTNCKAIELMKNYSTKHAKTKGNRWTLDFFHFVLDVCAFNAWTLFRLSQVKTSYTGIIEQRDFQRQLGLYLTQQHLKHRMQFNVKLPLPLKLQVAEILGENVESLLCGVGVRVSETMKIGSIPLEKASIPQGIVLQKREIENRRRCRACKSSKGTKIKTRCQQCLTPYCMRHLISRCEKCTNYELRQQEERLPPASESNEQQPSKK